LQTEMNERLHLAIGALPDKYRLVLWLRDIEEQSNDEVASTLGLTVPPSKPGCTGRGWWCGARWGPTLPKHPHRKF
jgi:hypothetical protein